MNTNEAGGTKRGRQDEPTTQDCKRHAQAAAASVSRADGKKQRMGQDVPVLGAASTVSGEGESGDAVRLVAQDAGVAVEAVQREDLSREQIAQAVVENTCHPGVQTAVASFLDRSQRQSLHRFCTAVRSMDPVVLDKVVDLLCNKVVSAAVASQAHLAMEEQRQRARLWRQQHEDMHEHHMDMECR